MEIKIISNPARVWEFINRYTHVAASTNMKGLGALRGDDLIAGVLYDRFTDSNVWMHIAALPEKGWLQEVMPRAAFRYPFIELDLPRVTASMESSNIASKKFAEKHGFVLEATMEGAGSKGSDVLIYKMLRGDCRYV